MGLPKFFLKPSVNVRCASLNSGVEKESLGSSFLRMSSSFFTCWRISSRRFCAFLSLGSTRRSNSFCGGDVGVWRRGSVCERVDDPVIGLSVHVVLPEDGARYSGAVKVSYDSFSHILGGLAAGDGVYGGNSCWTRSQIGRVGPVLCCFQGGKRTSLSTSLSLN